MCNKNWVRHMHSEGNAPYTLMVCWAGSYILNVFWRGGKKKFEAWMSFIFCFYEAVLYPFSKWHSEGMAWCMVLFMQPKTTINIEKALRKSLEACRVQSCQQFNSLHCCHPDFITSKVFRVIMKHYTGKCIGQNCSAHGYKKCFFYEYRTWNHVYF